MGNKICACICTLALTTAAPALAYGEWLFPPTDLANVYAIATDSYTVIDALGNGMAAFATNTNLAFERRYNKSSRSWDAAALQISPIGQAIRSDSLSIAMNGIGNAISLWKNSTLNVIQARLYDAATTSWQTTTTLASLQVTSYGSSSITINPTNKALAIWNDTDMTTYYLKGSYYNGSTWGASTTILQFSNGIQTPHVVIDNTGNGIAIWQTFSGTNYIIETCRYIGGSGWDPANTTTLSVIAGAMQDSNNAHIAIDGAGNAFTLWDYNDGVNTRIEAVRYTPGGGWDIANTFTISPAGEDSFEPQIAINQTGNAIAVWANGTLGLIQASHYNIGTNTWSPAITINATGVSTMPKIGIDDAGNGIATWYQNIGGQQYIQTSYYKKNTNTWNTIQTLSVPSSFFAANGDIAMNSSGYALANWIRYNESSSKNIPQGIYFDADPAYQICLKCKLLTAEYIANKIAQP